MKDNAKEERQEKITELIEKFNSGYDRYKSSQTLRNCINALANGADPIILIDQLVECIDNQLVEMQKLASNKPIVYQIDKETFLKYHGKQNT